MPEALRYVVILQSDPLDGGFNVRIPTFPHAHTQGDDVEDALRNAREIIELEVEVMIERGETLPESDGHADIVSSASPSRPCHIIKASNR
jgi:predicted RNase H-like HicB family nuclease